MDVGGCIVFAKGQNIIQLFEQFAPKYLAIEDDRIGLQLGTLNKEVKKVLLTLDVLDNVVDEAIQKEIDLIISHHAIIHKPLKQLRTDLPQGQLYEKLIKNDIAVYVAHTNLDSAEKGVNHALANLLGLKGIELLEVVYRESLKKLVVFVPESHHQQVLNALSDSGAGWIGKYSHCSFNMDGTGTFMPREGTDPFIGQQGVLEKVNEVRIETVVPERLQNKVIKAMLKAHPYEEVAYDIYPLELDGKEYGIGKIGKLDKSVTLKEFAEYVKVQLNVDGVRVIGDMNHTISKVAIAGGDGNTFVSKAAFKGADVLVTGDIYYHVGHEAMAQGIAIIDAGHYIEKHVLENVKKYLEEEFAHKKINTEVIISEVNTNPFKFI